MTTSAPLTIYPDCTSGPLYPETSSGQAVRELRTFVQKIIHRIIFQGFVLPFISLPGVTSYKYWGKDTLTSCAWFAFSYTLMGLNIDRLLYIQRIETMHSDLIEAIQAHDFKMVEKCLERGADPNQKLTHDLEPSILQPSTPLSLVIFIILVKPRCSSKS